MIGAVNRVFASVMREDVTEIAYDSRARLYAGQETENDPPVQLHVFTAPLAAADRTRVQAAAIAREILSRVGQPFLDRKENRMRTLRYRDIAVLSPRMKGVDEVLTRVLGAQGIPAYAEGSGAGLQSDEIAQVLCHLRLMDNIRDDLSLLACLRSPRRRDDGRGAGGRPHPKAGWQLSGRRTRCRPKGTTRLPRAAPAR